MDAVNLHPLIHLIYNIDKTGLKVTCSSSNQNLLAVKGSKRFTVLFMEKTITMIFMSASGLSNWSCVKESTESLSLNNCVAGTYVPYINFHLYEF